MRFYDVRHQYKQQYWYTSSHSKMDRLKRAFFRNIIVFLWLTWSLILFWKDLSSDLAKSSRRKIQLLAKTLILWQIYIQWTYTVNIQSAPLEINYWYIIYGNREINIKTTSSLFYFNVCQAALGVVGITNPLASGSKWVGENWLNWC